MSSGAIRKFGLGGWKRRIYHSSKPKGGEGRKPPKLIYSAEKLKHRTLIAVKGPQAGAFLQELITNDMKKFDWGIVISFFFFFLISSKINLMILGRSLGNNSQQLKKPVINTGYISGLFSKVHLILFLSTFAQLYLPSEIYRVFITSFFFQFF
jgi:hypothetical protein